MDSAEEQELSSASSELSQPAQRPFQDLRPEEGDLDSFDEGLSDIGSNELTTPTAIAPDVSTPSVADSSESSQNATEGKDPSTSDNEGTEQVSGPTRPNKYHGPASTWRNWTASERDLAASLDRLTAQDLSIHLYNAFKLKQRSSARIRNQSSRVSSDDESDEAADWKPPKVWTAWPLPPENVPREGDGKRWEQEGSLGRRTSTKPRKASGTLREMLVAQVLRIARERFSKRESEDPAVETNRSRQATSIEQAAKAPFDGQNDDGSKTFKPVVMADDERASEILQPTIHHVLAKLDHLLMGLHHARSYYFEVDDSASESQSLAAAHSKPRKPRKRKRSTSTLSYRPNMMTDASTDSGLEGQMESRSMSRSRSRPRKPSAQSSRSRKRRLGLRDWSDVLGVASLTGWDSVIVERAASRCASLFGEGITFRSLEAGSTGFIERSHLPTSLEPLVTIKRGLPEKGEVAETGGPENDMFGGVHVDGYLQPIEPKKSWKYTKGESKRRSTSRKVMT